VTTEPAPRTRAHVPPQIVRTPEVAVSPQLVPVPEPTPEPAPAAHRAGRNLPTAFAVGLGLGAIVLVSLFTRKELFVGVLIATIIVAIWEIGVAMRQHQIRLPYVPVGVGGAAILVAAYAQGTDGMVAAFGLTVVAVLVWRLLDGQDGYLRDVTAGVFVTTYVCLLAGFAMLMLSAHDGARRVLFFIIVVIASDIGGYAVGVLIGRHPMAPTISPKKSWEGFGGSVTLCAISGGVGMPILLHGQWWQGVLIGLAAVCTAVLGDLAESMIKRDLGVKDMGHLLPGHGGMMDRLDSLLPSAPVVWLLLVAFLS
jgi:phosphatidate cytidylyltransferase